MEEIKLRGSYLAFQIFQVLSESNTPLSIKEIAEHLHTYETKREQYNFETRIRWWLQYFKQKDRKIIRKSNRGRILKYHYELSCP